MYWLFGFLKRVGSGRFLELGKIKSLLDWNEIPLFVKVYLIKWASNELIDQATLQNVISLCLLNA